MSEETLPFNKQMRLSTRDVHSVSDALVNAKLAFALPNNKVWAEGLLVFYEIFRYLEEAMARYKGTDLGNMYVEGMSRTKAFEEDLEFYLGKDWKKSYEIRESVAKYLLHLQKIEKEDPILLIAYIYHLYMGLLSGGQILRKKRMVTNKLFRFTTNELFGNAVTDFGDISIAKIKRTIIDNINNISLTLTEEEKKKILEEGRVVFLLNNTIIQSISSADAIFLRYVLMALILLVIVLILIYYFVYF